MVSATGGQSSCFLLIHNTVFPLTGVGTWSRTPHVSLYTYHMTHQPLTDVNDVSMFVHHDVAIVSVFDLQQVTDQRVGSHALDKVGPGLWGRRRRSGEGEEDH